MEMRSNDILHEKINAVTDLPDGYAPNLASKWELIDAAVNKVEIKRKPTLFYVKRISAVAAMLLMIGGSWLMFVRKPQTAKPQAIINPSESLPNKQESVVEVKSIQVKGSTSKPSSKHRIENNLKLITQPLPDTPLEIIPEAPLIEQMVHVEKPAHFTEVDFTDPVISNTPPTETVVKAQRFKFKLGAANHSEQQAATSAPRSIGFKTSF